MFVFQEKKQQMEGKEMPQESHLLKTGASEGWGTEKGVDVRRFSSLHRVDHFNIMFWLWLGPLELSTDMFAVRPFDLWLALGLHALSLVEFISGFVCKKEGNSPNIGSGCSILILFKRILFFREFDSCFDQSI